MAGLEDIGRMLVFFGVMLILFGGLILLFGRLGGIGLGRLPGDIVIQRDNFSCFFPLTSMILISILLTLLLNLLARLIR